MSQWADPLAGHPRYASLRTISRSSRSFVQLALDRATGERVAIKFTNRGARVTGAACGSSR